MDKWNSIVRAANRNGGLNKLNHMDQIYYQEVLPFVEEIGKLREENKKLKSEQETQLEDTHHENILNKPIKF